METENEEMLESETLLGQAEHPREDATKKEEETGVDADPLSQRTKACEVDLPATLVKPNSKKVDLFGKLVAEPDAKGSGKRCRVA